MLFLERINLLQASLGTDKQTNTQRDVCMRDEGACEDEGHVHARRRVHVRTRDVCMHDDGNEYTQVQFPYCCNHFT